MSPITAFKPRFSMGFSCSSAFETCLFYGGDMFLSVKYVRNAGDNTDVKWLDSDIASDISKIIGGVLG